MIEFLFHENILALSSGRWKVECTNFAQYHSARYDEGQYADGKLCRLLEISFFCNNMASNKANMNAQNEIILYQSDTETESKFGWKTRLYDGSRSANRRVLRR